MQLQNNPPAEENDDVIKIKMGRDFAEVEASRLDVDVSQVQQIKSSTNVASTPIVGAGTPLSSGYWVTSQAYNSTLVTSEVLNDQGFAIPFNIDYYCHIDAVGIFIIDGTSPTAYNTRIGIYEDVAGYAGTLLASTNVFNYGDGSTTNNTLRTISLQSPIYLSPGRYWIVMRRSGNTGGAATARFRWRVTNPGHTMVTEDDIESNTPGDDAEDSSAWSITFTGAGASPELPGTLDPSDFLYLVTPPEIWLRTA